MRRSVIYILASALIIMWVYAAGSKLSEFGLFMAQLKRQPLPEWSLSLLQVGIPAVELLTVLLLCFKRTLMSGFRLSVFLLTSFTIYIGFGLVDVYGSIPCSCGGILGSISWSGHLIFNLVFLALALLGAYLIKEIRRSRDNKFIN